MRDLIELPEYSGDAFLGIALNRVRALPFGMDSRSVERRSETTRLLDLLHKPERGLNIVSVSGPGGVGKSFLVKHVLEELDARKNGWLCLRVDGSDADNNGDFLSLVEGRLASRKLPPPAPPTHDYFPAVRNVSKIARDLQADVQKELLDLAVGDDVKTTLMSLLRAGKALNKAIPITKAAVDVSSLPDERHVGELIDAVASTAKGLSALKEKTSGPLRDLLGVNFRNRVKRELFAVTAEAFVSDVQTAIAGWAAKGSWKELLKAKHSRITGIDKLLLIVDDFEVLSDVLGEFLVGPLVRQLAEAPFTTVLVVVGRDDLVNTHPGWAQHCGAYLRPDHNVRLKPFSREEALTMLQLAGIDDPRASRLYEDTQGFPFLLSLVIEEASEADAQSVMFLKRFVDRTSRWMTDVQREWFVRVCYLDQINLETLARLFPEPHVKAVQAWFEGEASIRDPDARVFRVRPLIRDKILLHQEVRDPAGHKLLLEKARSGSAPSASSGTVTPGAGA